MADQSKVVGRDPSRNSETIRIVVDVPREQIEVRAPASRWMRASASPLGPKHVRRLVRAGEIPASRPGKFLLIDREAHDAWIAKHRLEQAAPEADDLEAIFGLRPARKAVGR
jgi:excisionase family DNA binding protein